MDDLILKTLKEVEDLIERRLIMTREQLRKTTDYTEAMNKIRKYSKGFQFTLYYSEIPKAKANALKILMNDCIKCGLVESISIGVTIQGNIADETFRKL